MKKRNLIVFDIDGTLTNSVSIHQKAFTKALGQIGVDKIDSNYKTYKHHTDSYIAKVIYEKNRNKIFVAQIISKFETLLTKNIAEDLGISEIKGAKKLLETIEKNSDYGICFATGSLLKPAILKLQQAGIKFNSKLLVAANEILDREGIVKAAILKAEKYYDVSNFEKIISVGDGLWDLKTALNLSLKFVGVGLKNKDLLLKNGAKVILEDLEAFHISNIESILS